MLSKLSEMTGVVIEYTVAAETERIAGQSVEVDILDQTPVEMTEIVVCTTLHTT